MKLYKKILERMRDPISEDDHSFLGSVLRIGQKAANQNDYVAAVEILKALAPYVKIEEQHEDDFPKLSELFDRCGLDQHAERCREIEDRDKHAAFIDYTRPVEIEAEKPKTGQPRKKTRSRAKKAGANKSS